jgi:hypothetical protein
VGGPVLIFLFAFALVHLARAAQRLAGWMTFFGATTLVWVSLIEITFYIRALRPNPDVMPSISLGLISAVQHLYFIVAAPALFLPLGFVLLGSFDTSASLWISGAHTRNRICCLGSNFSTHSLVASGSHSICRSSGVLVVSCRRGAHFSQRQNLAGTLGKNAERSAAGRLMH